MFSRFSRVTLFLLIVVLVGFGCAGASKEEQASIKPITLEYWRVFDDVDDFQESIASYRAQHPHIRINYKKLRAEEYERALLEAFAEDRGPDIFSIHNTWIGGYANKITPMPKQTTVAKITVEGSLKKERKIVLEKKKTLSASKLQKSLVPVVTKDIIRDVLVDPEENTFEKKVLGLPLSVDTMVMFYNNDILSQAGIPNPPVSWEQFQNAVKLITKYSGDDSIIQAGAGIGTARNVNRSTDIVSLLMMQNGAKMTNEFDEPTFHRTPAELAGERELPPGVEALIFYTEFANPLETVYTWNSQMPDAFEAFADGKVGFFFGYNYHIPLLKAANPKLNYSFSSVPQLDPNFSANHASYWVETVAKKTENPDEAWDFLQHIIKKDNVEKYLERTNRPTASRSIMESQLENPELEPFVSQLLTAQSWYRGKDSNAMEGIMMDMIEEALANAPIDPRKAFQNAINRAISRLSQTL